MNSSRKPRQPGNRLSVEALRASNRQGRSKAWQRQNEWIKGNQPLIRRLPFARVVKDRFDALQEGTYATAGYKDYRIQYEALEALQNATENFLVDIFVLAQLCAEHAKRVTIMEKDILLVLKIKRFQGWK